MKKNIILLLISTFLFLSMVLINAFEYRNGIESRFSFVNHEKGQVVEIENYAMLFYCENQIGDSHIAKCEIYIGKD